MSDSDLFSGTEIDPAEAPEGFYPVLKSSLDHNLGNLCLQCDWRPGCQKNDHDLIKETRYSCMPWRRRDGMSVAFKRKIEEAWK